MHEVFFCKKGPLFLKVFQYCNIRSQALFIIVRLWLHVHSCKTFHFILYLSIHPNMLHERKLLFSSERHIIFTECWCNVHNTRTTLGCDKVCCVHLPTICMILKRFVFCVCIKNRFIRSTEDFLRLKLFHKRSLFSSDQFEK